MLHTTPARRGLQHQQSRHVLQNAMSSAVLTSASLEEIETGVPVGAMEALEKAPAERTEADVGAILGLCTGLAALEKYPGYTRKELARRMSLVRYAAGDVVFYEGDPPDGYRIILTGSVYGMKQSADVVAAAAAAGVVELADGPVEGIATADGDESRASVHAHDAEREGRRERRVLQRGRAMEAFSQIIFTLRAGDGFGEGAMQKVAEQNVDDQRARKEGVPSASSSSSTLGNQKTLVGEEEGGEEAGEEALARKYGVRGATIKCAEPCDMLLVSLEDYVQILELAMQRDLEERVEFLAQRPLFYGWSTTRLNQLAKCITVQKFLPNKPIFVQGSEGKFLWIIRRGSVKVVREIQVGRNRQTHAPIYKLLQCASLGQGRFFGELSIIRNTPHSASAIAASKTILYKLPKPEFTKFIIDKTLEIVQRTAGSYPSDAELVASYRDHLRWEQYKSRLVSQIMREKTARKELETFHNPSIRGFSSRRGPSSPNNNLHIGVRSSTPQPRRRQRSSSAMGSYGSQQGRSQQRRSQQGRSHERGRSHKQGRERKSSSRSSRSQTIKSFRRTSSKTSESKRY